MCLFHIIFEELPDEIDNEEVVVPLDKAGDVIGRSSAVGCSIDSLDFDL